MNIQYENLLKDALLSGINIFLGSAFSILAKNAADELLPTSQQLAEELSRTFELGDTSALSLAQICTILESSRRNEFIAFIAKRMKVATYDSRYYSALHRINLKAVFTTNVDDLLYKIYGASSMHYLNNLDLTGPNYGDRSAIDFIPLHGSILDDHRPLRFGSLDVASAFYFDPDRWHFLTDRLRRFPTLFWGYGMNDAGTLTAINPPLGGGRGQQNRWIILLPDSKHSVVSYYEALGFHIIFSDTSEFLSYLCSIDLNTETDANNVSPSETRSLFPDEAIPDLSSISLRPIVDFYLGAPPAWADIFTGRLHRTAYFHSISNHIRSPKPTIVIGVPACGKTTLMMQIASEIRFNGHKIVLDSPTMEKSQLIANKLNGSRALILVDNIGESPRSFEFLSHLPGVTAIGFERDYVFDWISNRFPVDRFEVFDITELSATDIQAILANIPSDYRLPSYKRPKIADGLSPSLHEIMEANLTANSLEQRLPSVLKQLSNKDIRLLDMLIACCYVHSCRTPISMDMLLAFFSGMVLSYGEIYEMAKNLGKMVADYYGAFADSEQDHFVPRSTIISDAVMKRAPASTLKRVILRFHKNVSPIRICRLHIFKAHAFRSALLATALPDWEEGVDFYRSVSSRDESDPYIRQQAALYLAKKKRFREAFSWIDEALVLSKNRITSIRRSHAKILFDANVDCSNSDASALKMLDRSMQILLECHRQEKKKSIHSLTFGWQALRYSAMHWNSNSRRYLDRALEMINKEMEYFPWHRRLKSLQQAVQLRRLKIE